MSLDSQIDALASIRGKVGYAFGPNWMIYGTGGAAFANVENTLVSTESSTIAPQIPLTPFQCGQPALCTFSANTGSVRSGSDTTPLFGYAVGGGIDYKWQIDPGSAVVFGVEYLHYGFPERALTLSNDNGNTVSFRAKESVDVVKGRISYLFSIH